MISQNYFLLLKAAKQQEINKKKLNDRYTLEQCKKMLISFDSLGLCQTPLYSTWKEYLVKINHITKLLDKFMILNIKHPVPED